VSLFTKLPIERYDEVAFDASAEGSAFTLGNAKALVWLSQLAYETDGSDRMTKVLRP
jgi:triacylglycerol lipase